MFNKKFTFSGIVLTVLFFVVMSFGAPATPVHAGVSSVVTSPSGIAVSFYHWVNDIFASGGFSTSNVAAVNAAMSASKLSNQLGLDPESRCNLVKTTTFKVKKNLPEHVVFDLFDQWHRANPCLEDLAASAVAQDISAPIQEFLYQQMLYVLSRPEVRLYKEGETNKMYVLKDIIDENERIDLSKVERIVRLNNLGVAYDAMGAADLTMFGLSTHYKLLKKGGTDEYRLKFYKTIGIAAMELVLDRIKSGGLRSGGACDLKSSYTCAWFHSKTSKDSPARNGGTLNKHLQVARDLGRAADLMENIDGFNGTNIHQGLINKFNKYAVAGVNQLVYSSGHLVKKGAPPNFFDFVRVKANGKAVQNSWLLYSYTPTDASGYFLKDSAKNCGYHIRDITLLYSIFKNQEGEIDTSGYTEKDDWLGKSILEFMIKTFKLKEKDGLFVDSKTPGVGNFGACSTNGSHELPDSTIEYLLSL